MDGLRIHEKDIQDVLQFFFDGTQWAMSCGGYLLIEDEEWNNIIKDFKRTFKQDRYSKEYIIYDYAMFKFINDQIMTLVDMTILRLVDEGLGELAVRNDGEIIFRKKDQG